MKIERDQIKGFRPLKRGQNFKGDPNSPLVLLITFFKMTDAQNVLDSAEANGSRDLKRNIPQHLNAYNTYLKKKCDETNKKNEQEGRDQRFTLVLVQGIFYMVERTNYAKEEAETFNGGNDNRNARARYNANVNNANLANMAARLHPGLFNNDPQAPPDVNRGGDSSDSDLYN